MSILKFILISSLSLGISLLTFKLFLKKGVDFKSIRFFLLAATIISLLVPFQNFSIDIHQYLSSHNKQKTVLQSNTEIPLSGYNSFENSLEKSNSLQKVWNLILYNSNLFFFIYKLICALFLLKFLVQLLVLHSVYKKSIKKSNNKYTLVINNRFNQAFTFFKWVFIPREQSEIEDYKQIIEHEQIHASQYHSFDLLLMEFLLVFLWFNPLLWIMKRYIQLVHEYQADEGVLNTGINQLNYKAILINQVAEENLISFSSCFNNSLIKKRIIMMTNRKMHPKTKLKTWSLIPLFTIVFIGSSVMNAAFAQNEEDKISIRKIEKKESQKNENLKISVNDNSIIVKDGDISLESAKIFFDGKQIENTEGIDPENIESITVLKEKNKILIISKKDKQPSKNKVEIKVQEKVLYYVDDVKKSEFDIKSIDPESIESIEVIKNKDVISQYTGEECDGIVYITTKKKKEEAENTYTVEDDNGILIMTTDKK